jgi:hypothetical protein
LAPTPTTVATAPEWSATVLAEEEINPTLNFYFCTQFLSHRLAGYSAWLSDHSWSAQTVFIINTPCVFALHDATSSLTPFSNEQE